MAEQTNWVQCERCQKWRRITNEYADTVDDEVEWWVQPAWRFSGKHTTLPARCCAPTLTPPRHTFAHAGIASSTPTNSLPTATSHKSSRMNRSTRRLPSLQRCAATAVACWHRVHAAAMRQAFVVVLVLHSPRNFAAELLPCTVPAPTPLLGCCLHLSFCVCALQLSAQAGGSAALTPAPEPEPELEEQPAQPLPKLPAVVQLISENYFSHRKRKEQDEDDIMVCHCPPPWRGGDGCGPNCINRMLCIECTEVGSTRVVLSRLTQMGRRAVGLVAKCGATPPHILHTNMWARTFKAVCTGLKGVPCPPHLLVAGLLSV